MNRTRYDDRMLEYCKENAQKTIEIIDRVLLGEISLGRAAHEAGYDAIGFRKVLAAIESVADPRPKETPKDIAPYRSTEEMFYGDVFCISIDDYDELWNYIPNDSANVMQWVFSGADGALNPKEAAFLEERYDGNMTLEDIAKEYGITRERVRQIISKAIRKMRRPSIKQIMCGGMMMKDEIQKEFLMQKEEIIRGLVDEKLKIDEDIKAAEIALEDPKETIKKYDTVLDKRIEELGLSVRSFNCLARANYRTVRDLTKIKNLDEMIRIRNLGRRSCEEIIDKLVELGVRCPITGGRSVDEL